MNTPRKTPRKPDRKLVEYPSIHPRLETPEHLLIALPSATKRAWLRALRSGDYIQGEGSLRKLKPGNEPDNQVECFCCLGVLADIVDTKAWSKTSRDTNDFWYVWYGRTGILPHEPEGKMSEKLVKVMQQPVKDADTFPETVMNMLYRANDSGATFEQIALWIERYL